MPPVRGAPGQAASSMPDKPPAYALLAVAHARVPIIVERRLEKI